MKFVLLAVAAAVAVALATPAAILADRVYHSEHLPLLPVGGAPLRSGFVENIHPNGPVVYAREVYVLNGALPSTTYEVVLLIYLGRPACDGGPDEAIPSATITTNRAGNGRADFAIPVGEVPEEIRNAIHGVRWEVRDAESGEVAYATACTSVELD